MKPLINLIFLAFISVVLITGCEKEDEPTSGTFTDARDENTYEWVKIGDQVWMAENLAYLPKVNQPLDWSSTAPRFYVYDYDGDNVSEAKATNNFQTYGVLYNWSAAKIACPDGWHLPSDEEWKELELFLGMDQNEVDIDGYDRGENIGVKLKAMSGWFEEGNGTDEYGFSALPGGVRKGGGLYSGLDYLGKWWSSTIDVDINTQTWYRMIDYNDSRIYRFSSVIGAALSIRCVKD